MHCPICAKPVPPSKPTDDPRSAWPFCSDRCRLIDLGRWLGGKYQIPVEAPQDEDEPRLGDAGERR